jgi:hypothetical protein
MLQATGGAVCCVLLAVAYQRQVKASEKKMAKFMQQAHEQLDAGFELKAVFVTFNTQREANKCLAGCPRRECICRQGFDRVWWLALN